MDENAPPQWFLDAQQGDWKIGDDVVVSLDECWRHGYEEAGVRGTVVATDGALSTISPDHQYTVWFYRALDGSRGAGRGRQCWHYTAGELRRFDPLSAID